MKSHVRRHRKQNEKRGERFGVNTLFRYNTLKNHSYYTEISDETTQETHTHKQITIGKFAENLNKLFTEIHMSIQKK